MIHRAAFVRHISGIAPFVTAMFVWPAVAPLAAIATAMGVFMLTHELAHGVFRLSRRGTDLALAITGACMATSGHGLRLVHLRHHSDPLGPDDVEGISARLSPLRALIAAPRLYVRVAVAAWRTATPHDRRWQRFEYAAIAALVIAAVLGPRPLQIYVVTAIALQALAPFWAGHLPHHPPAWLLALARPLVRLGSLTMTTLVAHDRHHRWPKRPVTRLRRDAISSGPRLGAPPAA